MWCTFAPLLSPWCAKEEVQSGVNLNRYAGLGYVTPWHCDDKLLFSPQNSPELTERMSLGYSVEFQVRRRASWDVPSSITLDHGDFLVMDGPAQAGSFSRGNRRNKIGNFLGAGLPVVNLGVFPLGACLD